MGIACAFDSSIAVDVSGNVWEWGYTYDDATETNQPFKLDDIDKVVETGIGAEFFFGLKEDGMLYTWGGDPADAEHGSGAILNGYYPTFPPPYPAYFNPIEPKLEILQGNLQSSFGFEYLQLPLIFKVTDYDGHVLTNAPVIVQVVQGDLVLSTNQFDNQYSYMVLTTDTNGLVQLYGYADGVINSNCIINVYAASPDGGLGAQTNFSETIQVPNLEIEGGQSQTNVAFGSYIPIVAHLSGARYSGNHQRSCIYNSC